MKVEYRNLPHNGGKVHKLGIGAGSLHEAALQEIKDISFFPLHHDHSSVYTAVQVFRLYSGWSCSPGAVQGRDVKNAQNEVSMWLHKIGITETQFQNLVIKVSVTSLHKIYNFIIM